MASLRVPAMTMRKEQDRKCLIASTHPEFGRILVREDGHPVELQRPLAVHEALARLGREGWEVVRKRISGDEARYTLVRARAVITSWEYLEIEGAPHGNGFVVGRVNGATARRRPSQDLHEYVVQLGRGGWIRIHRCAQPDRGKEYLFKRLLYEIRLKAEDLLARREAEAKRPVSRPRQPEAAVGSSRG